MSASHAPWSRRTFLATSAAAGVGLAAWGLRRGIPGAEGSAASGGSARQAASLGGNRLPFAPELRPHEALLRVAPGTRDLGRGVEAPLLLVNDALPSPLLRLTRGETFSARMENGIEDPLVLHWHGLTAPDDMDGHPRFAVPTGASLDYRFEVTDRAGTYWYHPHPHHRTGYHRSAAACTAPSSCTPPTIRSTD